jgi:hypothetical protein
MLVICLIHFRPGALDSITQHFALKIKEGLNHEETALISHLGMEEEFQLSSKLTICHALNFVLDSKLLDLGDSQLNIKPERLVQGLASTTDRQLHPQLLESLRVKFRNLSKKNWLRTLDVHGWHSKDSTRHASIHHSIETVGRSCIVVLRLRLRSASVKHSKQIILLLLS